MEISVKLCNIGSVKISTVLTLIQFIPVLIYWTSSVDVMPSLTFHKQASVKG